MPGTPQYQESYRWKFTTTTGTCQNDYPRTQFSPLWSIFPNHSNNGFTNHNRKLPHHVQYEFS